MIEKYPNNADIYEVISSKMPFGNSRDFFKKRGVMCVANRRTEIALYCSRLFLGFEDYEEMRSHTESENNYKKICGIELETVTSLPDIATTLSAKRGDTIAEKTKLMIKDVTSHDDGTVTCVISYQNKKLGKLDLLRKEDQECTFKIEERGDKKLVLTHHEKNEDYSKIIEVVENVSEGLADDEKILLQKITLEKFTIPQRIEFFDKLLLYNYDDWILENVISIKIRKGEELEDEEFPEIAEIDLRGINEALLRGDNLRTNETVKKFEKSGYYFSGIIIKLAHKHDPIKIFVETLFKSKPELPEINIKKSVEVMDDMENTKILPINEQEKYLKEFWEILYKIYSEFIEEVFQEKTDSAMGGQ